MFTRIYTGFCSEPAESSSHRHTLIPSSLYLMPYLRHALDMRESHFNCLGKGVAVLSVRYALRQKKELGVKHVIQYSRICWSLSLYIPASL